MRDGRALSSLYRELEAALCAGEHDRARAAYLAATGLGARQSAADVTASQPAPAAVELVAWDTPRRIDLIALDRGARDVAKFEDLTRADARRLEAWGRARGLQAVVAGPYAKQFDLALAEETSAGELYSAILSRGTQAAQVAEAELERGPEGTRRAGLALGYPACCVDQFAALSRDGMARRDGVNEAALRSVEGLRDGLPWELNPLYQASPVGFTPCRADCPAALAFARRLLTALEAEDAPGFRTVRATLQRPVLFLRHSLVFVLDGAAPLRSRTVEYSRAVPGDPGERWRSSLGALHWQEVGRWLAAGDGVRLGDVLEVTRQGVFVARWPLADAEVPLLLRPF